ncbi:glutaredoxin family protein [Microbacterium kunmingense]|uniref:glutaredoxin family protein n=1 Tax=Microbacterium kunmingense TaxID=2915939 RepID=UPI003D75C952
MTTELAIHVETDSTRDAAAEPTVVTVYTARSACMQCTLTEKVLAELGIPFVECDITRDENRAARDYVIGDLGYARAPVVVVDEHDHWSGFQPGELKRLAAHFGSRP